MVPIKRLSSRCSSTTIGRFQSSVRFYASISKDQPEDEEYEIDLVTLQKKFKSKDSPSSGKPVQQQHLKSLEPFGQEFKNELNLLRNFLSSNPSLTEVASTKTRINKDIVKILLGKFKSNFYKDYASNQSKFDVSKITQMCDYLQRNDQVFQKLFIKSEDDQINDILRIFNKPLEKKRKKDLLDIKQDPSLQKIEKQTAASVPKTASGDNHIADDFDVKLDDYIARENTHTVSHAENTKSQSSEKKSVWSDYNSAVKLLNLTRKKPDKSLELEKEIKTRFINHGKDKNHDIPFLDQLVDQVTSSPSTEPIKSETGGGDLDDSNLQKLTASAIRDKYAKLYNIKDDQKQKVEKTNKVEQVESLESIESFLKKLKQTNEFSKEEEFKRQKAYEWSKFQLVDNPLEKGRFFTPKLIPGTLIPFNILSPFNTYNKNSPNDLLFPKLTDKNSTREYLLLTSSGKTINCGNENPLGFNFIPKDVFSILNSLETPEIFIKHIKKLSKKNWKLVGGGDGKILIFSRISKPHLFRSFIKNFFTLIGFSTTLLVLGSFFIDGEALKHSMTKREFPTTLEEHKLNKDYLV